MKNRIRVILIGCAVGLCLFAAGCGKNKNAFIVASETIEAATEVVLGTATEDVAEAVEADSRQEEQKETVGQQDTDQETRLLEPEVYVYVCGAVQRPGVYILQGVPRICDAIEAAGGFCENAAQDYWNMAEKLADGQMIYIPTEEEARERNWDVLEQKVSPENGLDEADSSSGKVNLNTASKEQLMTIPGIGESKADSIISYREKNGAFSKVEEVMNISGIKDGLFEKMKEYITVE